MTGATGTGNSPINAPCGTTHGKQCYYPLNTQEPLRELPERFFDVYLLPCALCILAQVSFNETTRLNTGLPGTVSLSTQK
ncbi:hypothetical protein LX24_00968 [Desulfallas thermosapovorans DSM 6562]|uniref:Uncharacterized protein n=1 Tax=Desulfallas thermosapovorans DSM 6562 TaxID=1121431 RepID=A0A5S4ZU34_9FIRM|nr:hypothetical protein LX24_00968 [Desulfallas thermosapovorans DSM 6562]